MGTKGAVVPKDKKKKPSKTPVKPSKPKKKSKPGKTKGFLCCRKKAKKDSRMKKDKKKKDRKVGVQPGKPLEYAPAPNDELGDIVLVKNATSAPNTTPNKEPVSRSKKEGDKEPELPEKGMDTTPAKSKEKVVVEKEEKEEEKENEEAAKLEEAAASAAFNLTNDVPPPPPPMKEAPPIKDKGAKSRKKKEKHRKEPSMKSDDGDKMEKWTSLAKSIATQDANIAVKEFELYGSYIPPFVSKNSFLRNTQKNRFSDVICMDHSRVTLENRDYIHASWVDISDKKKAILTQFPLQHTSPDFWQMIIDQRVKCVLLLITDVEYNSFGGNFIFPQNQDFINFDTRGIRVGEFKKVDVAPGWTMRVISVTNGQYKSFVHIHHYKAWPHDGIPSNLKQIWQVQSALRKYKSPIVYMSLSGCGRAGSFALLETAHASLHGDATNFDMGKCLKKVRSGRMHAVQSLSQYSFVYALVAEHVLANGFIKLATDNGCIGDNEDEAIEKILKNVTIV